MWRSSFKVGMMMLKLLTLPYVLLAS
jgi:hypothetical protein